MRDDYARRKIKLAEEFGIRRTASISWTSLFGTILHGASARRLTTARSKSKRTNGTSSVLLSRSALPLGSAFGLHHSVAILTAMILVVVNIVLMYPRSALRPLPVAASRSMWLFPTFLSDSPVRAPSIHRSTVDDNFCLDDAQAGPSDVLEEYLSMDAEAIIDSMSTIIPDDDERVGTPLEGEMWRPP